MRWLLSALFCAATTTAFAEEIPACEKPGNPFVSLGYVATTGQESATEIILNAKHVVLIREIEDGKPDSGTWVAILPEGGFATIHTFKYVAALLDCAVSKPQKRDDG